MKDCNSCGKCCIKYGDGALSATQQEIELWELFNPEIYRYVKDGEIWFDPDTRIRLTRCPFLEEQAATTTVSVRYSCRIYQDRPEDCRLYPSLVSEMIRDECEMIEVTDLADHQQAQSKLNKLMQDSHKAAT